MAIETQHTADLPPVRDSAPRFGLVMSGGGARGAYEAGVLSWLLDDLPREAERVAVHVEIEPAGPGGPDVADIPFGRGLALGKIGNGRGPRTGSSHDGPRPVR